MRDFSAYEKQRWFDKYDRFGMGEAGELPEFLGYGDELGEAYDALIHAAEQDTYISKETTKALQLEILQMYYYQVHYFTGAYGGYVDDPTELGLPSEELFFEKLQELKGDNSLNLGDEELDPSKQAFDWAMDWRQEHIEEWQNRQRAVELRAALARLESTDGTP